MPFENHHGNSSNEAVGSAKNANTSVTRGRNNATTSRVGPLPTRSRTTLGGGPSVAANCPKSESLDTIASPCAAA